MPLLLVTPPLGQATSLAAARGRGPKDLARGNAPLNTTATLPLWRVAPAGSRPWRDAHQRLVVVGSEADGFNGRPDLQHGSRDGWRDAHQRLVVVRREGDGFDGRPDLQHGSRDGCLSV